MDVKAEIKNLKSLRLDEWQKKKDIDIEPQQLRKMVQLYNQAVESIQSKGDDIAAIELKKALSIYPDFLEAKLLLSLCYIIGRQMDTAKTLLLDITQQDNLMQSAHQYLKHVQSAEKKQRDIEKSRAFIDASNLPSRINKDIIKVVCGGLIGAVIAYLFLSSSIANTKNDYETEKTVWNEQKHEYNVTIGDYRDQLSNANVNIQGLEHQVKQKQDKISYLTNVQKIAEIEKHLLEGNRSEAANMLLALNNYPFESAEKYIFNHLYDTTMEPLAEELYNEGYQLYRQGNNEDTIEILRQSMRYNPEGYFVPFSLYFVGRGYERQGDTTNAMHYFERLINEFPEHNYVRHAQSRLSIIGE